MINQKELCIGNLVSYYGEVKAVSGTNYLGLIRLKQILDVSENEIEPIPLTPEWLDRLGFQFLDSIINGRYYVKWANTPSEIAWYPLGEYVSINTSTGGEGEQPNYTEL